MAEDNWDDCPWDARRVRELVAGLVKSLIQARWKTEPDFLAADQLVAWFPPEGEELRADRRTVRTHLGYARRDMRELQRLDVLPDGGRSSESLVTGPAEAGELVGAIGSMLDADLTADEPLTHLCRAFDAPASDEPRWLGLIEWSELPLVRTLLNAFPGDRPRWDPQARELWFRGRLAGTVAPQAANQLKLLAACEEEGWQDWMDSPFSDTTDELEHVFKRLNPKLSGLRFVKTSDNQQVGWRSCPATDDAKNTDKKQTTRR